MTRNYKWLFCWTYANFEFPAHHDENKLRIGDPGHVAWIITPRDWALVNFPIKAKDNSGIIPYWQSNPKIIKLIFHLYNQLPNKQKNYHGWKTFQNLSKDVENISQYILLVQRLLFLVLFTAKSRNYKTHLQRSICVCGETACQ